ncbi:MAG: YibE/F family protein [Ruminococcus flavefaciens]|nr:YibE/F family protein [Ruminococcus flavefaciens]MCM1228696.1 YibE/F family protein [Ruminococcus flavefaciens]
MFRVIIGFFRKIWGCKKSDIKSVLLGFILITILVLIPTGYENAVIYQGTEKVKATVLSTDDTAIRDVGLIRSGEQVCTVRIEQGIFNGKTAQATNLLSGSMSQDKIFHTGDTAFVVVSHDDMRITSVTMIDHYRIKWEIILMIIFTIFLILFAGPGGLRALQSFMITVLCIWKIMIPYCLKGGNAILCGLIIVTLLTMIIIMFVYGLDKRSMTSVVGSMLGVLTACILGIIFTNALKIHGAVMTDSESLLYAGYENLDLTQIFMASIFIGASGAMMDLSVDITSGICEVIGKKPEISRLEAIGCGMRIGQAAMGTMTTTLLLAYAGSCITQLMVFMAQGTPLLNILNYKYVASEILQTLAGSFALVTVAPFTAIVGGILLTNSKNK